jgi:hypothetical protein
MPEIHDEVEKKLISIITQEFIEKISFVPSSNLGIFNCLYLICEKANLWELEIILRMAEKQPIKSESLHSDFNANISKSTLYRKIADYIHIGIFVKDTDGYLKLADELQALSIVARLRKNLNEEITK